MHILFLSDNFPPERNAPASRTYEHARRWVQAGEDVTVVTGVPNFPEGKIHDGYRNRAYQAEEQDGIRVVRVWSYVTANQGFVRRSLDHASLMASGALGAVVQRRPHVVISTSPQLLPAVGGGLAASVRRVPWVLEVRDLWPESIRAVGALRDGMLLRLLERVELFLYRRAARIVTVTEAFRRNIASRGISEEKISVVRNGVDLDLFRSRQKDEGLVRRLGLEGTFIVSYIGTHGMAHRLETILEAADQLREESVSFLLVGSGAEKEQLTRRAAEMRLSNVTFLDPRPRSEMPAFWSISNATVVPLRSDPLFRTTVPSKMFEAMAMGVPILLGVEGEAREILESSGAGLAFPPEDAEGLAGLIRKLARATVLREKIRKSALAAAPGFSRDEAAERMLGILREVAGVKAVERSIADSAGAVEARAERGV